MIVTGHDCPECPGKLGITITHLVCSECDYMERIA